MDENESPRVDELSLAELEALVEERRRIERARRFAQDDARGFRPVTVEPGGTGGSRKHSRRPRSWRDRILLAFEVLALVGLVVIIASTFLNLQELNTQVARAQKSFSRDASAPDTPTTELPGSSFPSADALDELPGSSSPPAALPSALGVNVAPASGLPAPTPGIRSPSRIVIPTLKIDWPIVEGDGWEELKAAVGHRIGSANPGERGNVVLSGHDDVYGEVFKDLENLSAGDSLLVYAGGHAYHYLVSAKRTVAPDDLSVLSATREPIVTLITCTPYQVDTQRLIVVAQLAP